MAERMIWPIRVFHLQAALKRPTNPAMLMCIYIENVWIDIAELVTTNYGILKCRRSIKYIFPEQMTKCCFFFAIKNGS